MTEDQRTLLIVDDENDILEAVERLLRKQYRVLSARTPEEAMEHLAVEPVQVVMSDQRMPTMSGVELLANIRGEYPSVVRVLLTGYSNIDHVIDAINEGHVYRYVSKPWDPAEFKSVVRQSFARWDERREREELVEQVREANVALAERNRLLSQKNEELHTLDRVKDVFMEVVSHELNTPIAVILGYAFLLKREVVDTENEVIRKAVVGIESNGNRLKNISTSIFKMLDQSDAHGVVTAPIDFGQLLGDVHTQVMPFLTKREQTVTLEIANDAKVLEGDQPKLHDIFLNLLMNAIKFSPDGEEIRVVAASDADPNFIVVSVCDRGIGIAEDDIEQVFNPFFSTFDSQYHSSGEFEFGKRGIGLGLAVARRFTQMHGGTIDVSSARGEGSTFRVRLPREQAFVV